MDFVNKCDLTNPENYLLMTRREVRLFDSWAINTLGIPGAVLMENAGRSCAELIIERLGNIASAKVCLFCGTGNNGGDGFVIARHLAKAGIGVCVVICGDRAKIIGDADLNLGIIERMKLPIERIDMVAGGIEPIVNSFAAGADMLVDAIFGTGLSGQLRREHVELIDGINRQNIPILAVDIPSGLDCDSGICLDGGGVCIKAAVTVTFVAVKKGFAASANAPEFTGDVFVASIGVDPQSTVYPKE